MTQQDPGKGNWTFEQDKARLQAVLSNLEGAKAAVRDTKAALEEEIAPYRERVKELETEEKVLRERLTIQALGNYASSGNKTFGGVQLREAPTVNIHDEQALIAALQGESMNSKPLVIVTYTLDKKALLEWAKARVSMGLDLPEGLEYGVNYSMALAAVKD